MGDKELHHHREIRPYRSSPGNRAKGGVRWHAAFFYSGDKGGEGRGPLHRTKTQGRGDGWIYRDLSRFIGIVEVERDGGGRFFLWEMVGECWWGGKNLLFLRAKRTVDKFGCLQPPKKMLKPHLLSPISPLFLLFLLIVRLRRLSAC